MFIHTLHCDTYLHIVRQYVSTKKVEKKKITSLLLITSLHFMFIPYLKKIKYMLLESTTSFY